MLTYVDGALSFSDIDDKYLIDRKGNGIYMPDMDGIETAKKLRELTEKTFLIFMTASEGHYPDAFSLHAFDYVTKPFTLERIDNLISEIVDHTPIDAIFIKITVGSVDERIYLKNIVSVTTDGHYLEIHKDDGESSRVRLTSGEFLSMTGADKRFIMINRGIIINMDFIDRIDGGDVYLDDRTIKRQGIVDDLLERFGINVLSEERVGYRVGYLLE